MIPELDRQQHGTTLQAQIGELHQHADVARDVQQSERLDGGLGIQIEFESFPGIELAFESLARDRSGIELLNVRSTADRTCATVFVPDGKLVHFEKLIQDYLEERRDSIGRARDHKRWSMRFERFARPACGRCGRTTRKRFRPRAIA